MDLKMMDHRAFFSAAPFLCHADEFHPPLFA
uniref:Uncharacterized protein n=1 Tax=Setaria italica TaxID=4555 RepID=K3ZFS4_SETIT